MHREGREPALPSYSAPFLARPSCKSLTAKKMEGIANRIEKLRVESGISDVNVAEQLGLSINEYGDLEAYDNEITDTVSLKTANNLASLFHISLLQLLAPEKGHWPEEQYSAQMMAKKALEVIKKEGISIEEAEEQVGWYLKEFLSNPESFIEENPIMFIKDLANFIGIQWLDAIPRKINS